MVVFRIISSIKAKGSMDTKEQSKPLSIVELHAILDKTKLDILQVVEARIDDRMSSYKRGIAMDNEAL